ALRQPHGRSRRARLWAVSAEGIPASRIALLRKAPPSANIRYTLHLFAAAGLAAVGLVFWLSSAPQSATEISSVLEPTTVSQICISELHNRAQCLPIQQVEDHSLVFNEANPK